MTAAQELFDPPVCLDCGEAECVGLCEPKPWGLTFRPRRVVRARKRYNRFARSLPRLQRIAHRCWSRLTDYQREYEAWTFGTRRHP